MIFRKIEETLDLGGTALLLQGGHHPNLRIEWYEDLFADIKSRYPIHLHALSPSEILHIAHVSRISLDETLAPPARRGPRLPAGRAAPRSWSTGCARSSRRARPPPTSGST